MRYFALSLHRSEALILEKDNLRVLVVERLGIIDFEVRKTLMQKNTSGAIQNAVPLQDFMLFICVACKVISKLQD